MSVWRYVVVAAVAATTAPQNEDGGRRLLSPPNVVIVVADDLGWGDLGCYGNDTLRTPNIDQLASEGALFSHALAAAALCTPSRAALLTGRYPVRSGMTSSGVARVIPFVASRGGLPPTEVTVARVARNRGYATALVGKWHLGLHCAHSDDFCHHPSNHGFDFFYGLPWSNARDMGGDDLMVDVAIPGLRLALLAVSGLSLATFVWLLSLVLQGQGRSHHVLCLLPPLLLGFLLPLAVWGVLSNLRLLNGVLMRDRDVVEQPLRLRGLHERLVREAHEFVQAQQRLGRPFLLVLAFTHVHTALDPTDAFRGRSRHGMYGDAVEEMDDAVGRLMRHLAALGVDNDTFFVFTSDHGGHLEERDAGGHHREGGHNGPFKGGKGMGGMEGGIRVPLLIRWPGAVSPGTVIHLPVSHMDLLPTVARLTGAAGALPNPVDGMDMLDLLSAGQRTTSPRLLVHYCGTHIHAGRWIEDDRHVWKVRLATPNFLPNTTECHFLCPCDGPGVTWHPQPLVFNVAQDPGEDRPVPPTDPKYQEVLSLVQDGLKRHRDSVAPVPNQLGFPVNMWLPWLQPCCRFPSCHCVEYKYPGDQ